MILGVGIDLISVSRIEKLMLNFKEKFLQKIFSVNEISQANKIKITDQNLVPRALFYAKRFAAKEAFAKAVGTGIGRGINFQDIEVENDALGKPRIQILNGKKTFLKNHFNCEDFVFHLSLTDEKQSAGAVVVIEKIL